MEREYQRVKIQAALAGVDIEKGKRKGKGEKPMKENAKAEKQGFIFKDPKEYEHLSQEERQGLTDKMMGQFKAWAKSPMPIKDGGIRGKNPIG